MFTFSFDVSRAVHKRAALLKSTTIEKEVIGTICIDNNGEYYVRAKENNYKLTDKSLDLNNKKEAYVFNIKHKKIYKIIINENEVYYNKKYMAVAPGYECVGKIIEFVNNVKKFEITKILNNVDGAIRKEFYNNFKEIVKAYNECNCTFETES